MTIRAFKKGDDKPVCEGTNEWSSSPQEGDLMLLAENVWKALEKGDRVEIIKRGSLNE